MGSGITNNLGTFVDRAKLSEDGDMRVSRDRSDLINKQGSIGQKIASFFTDIGRALGLVKDAKGNEAADRQKMALEGFRQALSRDFTETVANDVLKSYAGSFTGKFVLDSVRKAEDQSGQVKAHNARIDSQEQLSGVMSRLGLPSSSLTDGQRSDFHRHFSDLKSTALQGNLHKLEGQELADMAVDSLRLALGNERALKSDGVATNVGVLKSDLKYTYELTGGKDFDRISKAVDRQLQQASTAILNGPKEGLGPSGRKELMDDMKDALKGLGLNPRATEDALTNFGNVLSELRLYRSEPPRV
jgi:hypothetical protein